MNSCCNQGQYNAGCGNSYFFMILILFILLAIIFGAFVGW